MTENAELPLQILVADDDPATRQLLSAALTKWGYQVLLAEDGDIAWRRISFPGGAPKLLIIDVQMPHQDGYQLCERTRRELAPDYNPYIILLTQNTGAENVIKGLEAGANEFLTKPFNAAELHSRLLVGERIIRYEQVLQEQNQYLLDYLSKIESASALVVNAAQMLNKAMEEARARQATSTVHLNHSRVDEVMDMFKHFHQATKK